MNAKLHIQVAGREGCSFLKSSFFTTPFKLANITEDKSANLLHLMSMSSSPGILDRDEYGVNIEVDQNCSLQLHTQGYQRLFNMKHGATQSMQVFVDDGASFYYLPHPCVPHEGAVFTSRNSFYLGNNCSLVFGEVLTCGRKLNAEQFLFSKYHSITNVYINNRLVIKENLLMQPSVVNVQAIGQLESYTHQASMIWINEHVVIKDIQLEIIALLETEQNIIAGVSATPANGLIIRILGHGAEQLYDCLKKINELFAKSNTKIISYAH